MSILSMTKTLFKSIVHGPYTENYPAKPRENYERTRGSIENDIEDCIFCDEWETIIGPKSESLLSVL